jgi:arginine deiminase
MGRPLHITSEIGKLKTVLLHRPGEELENLVPDYLTDLLFDDIPHLEVAQKEHDAFAQVLRDRGVEVLYLDELVTEALADPSVRHEFIVEMVAASKQEGRRVSDALVAYLEQMDTRAMVRKIMAGVRKDELPLPEEHQQQLHSMVEKSAYPFYLDPMPNLYFTRDPAATIGNGLTINRMHWPARRRESLFMQYIINHHPRFAGQDIPVWSGRNQRFSIEGGDELVLSHDTMAIGISERTTAEAIETMATKLFAGSDFKRVIALEIPKSHAFMHLDTVFTMIDYDKFTIHPEIRDANGHLNIYILDKVEGSRYPKITKERDLEKVLREALHKESITLIECGNGDPIAAAREQWNDGSNTLAIAPGVVVTYDRNYVTNQALREAGLEVIEVAGSELGRGRGGPRCMSMPLVREDLEGTPEAHHYSAQNITVEDASFSVPVNVASDVEESAIDSSLKGRSLLTLKDFTPAEIRQMLDTAHELKRQKKAGIPHRIHEGKQICLLFEKTSTRTRCAFTVAANDLGVAPEFLGKDDIQLGKKESVEDTAKVLGRMFDGIEFRGFKQETVDGLAKHSGVPVWNGLTDQFHPTQILADFMTIEEHLGRLKGVKLVFVGDGRNNMANSLMIGSAIMGLDFRILAPSSLHPEPALVEEARRLAAESGARITVTDNRREALDGADAIYTDVWVSMGEESQYEERIALLRDYQVNRTMLGETGNPNIKFLHCLPSFHDTNTETAKEIAEKYNLHEMEVTDEVFRSEASVVFDEAENRMHTIKAVMALTL